MLAVLLLALPHSVFAAPATFKDFIRQLIRLLDSGTLVLFSVALVVFFWSVISNLWGYDGGNLEQRQKLRDTMFWGVIVIFVMVSIWGIIAILQQTLSQGL